MRSGIQRPDRRDQRSGQAIVEFIVGLVAVLVLIAGLLQVASLTKTHTDTMVNARQFAAEQAMIDADAPTAADDIAEWRIGADRKAFTRDDIPNPGDVGGFRDRIVARAAEDDAGWTQVDRSMNNPISDLHGNDTPASLLGLVKGSDSRSIVLLPAVRNLVYAAPSIEVRCDVWMTRTKGLY